MERPAIDNICEECNENKIDVNRSHDGRPRRGEGKENSVLKSESHVPFYEY